MAAPKTPIRWVLLTKRLELRARWRAFCNELAARSTHAPVLAPAPAPVATRF